MANGLLRKSGAQHRASCKRLECGVHGALTLFAATVAETPSCVTGEGCGAPALTGAASTSSLAAGIDSTALMMAPYFGTQGANVLTSFDPATYPGEVNPSRDLTNAAALYGAATVAAGAVSKARGIISTVRSAGSTISGLVKDAVGGLKGVFGFGAKGTANTALKLGETQTINDVSMTRVGRWMSPDELAQMQSSNKIVQGGGGQTFISTNGAADSKGAASKGSVYVEFDVPSSGLLQGGKEGWYKMIGPDASKSQQYLLNKQGEEHLPGVKNITVLDSKREGLWMLFSLIKKLSLY